MTKAMPVAEAPMHTPPRPGRIVRQDCIETLGLTIGEAAEALGVTRQTLDRLVNERGGISPEMDCRIGDTRPFRRFPLIETRAYVALSNSVAYPFPN